MTDLATLNTQFGIDQQLVFTSGVGDLTVAEISNSYAQAVIALHGAHVLSFQPHGQRPVLWLSEYSQFKIGKAIRGGIPICWPWFAAHPSDPSKPSHGFARTTLWAVAGSEALADGSTQLRLELHDSAETQALWPHPFRLELVVRGVVVRRLLLLEIPEFTRGFGPSPYMLAGSISGYLL